jgi:hypothetical protein
MDRDQFATFVRRPYVMIFWMSCAKYQGTQAYSFAPIADYTPEDQKKIQTTPGFLNFTVALPLSQEKRLVELFESPATGKIDRLDLVVLTKDESMTGFAPPESEFELSFENRLFRVWTRRSGQATSAATR